jgi:hypothetical protein
LGPTGAGASEEATGNFARWRCLGRDGVNCLYLQLRLLGYAGTYEEVVAAVPGGPEQANLGGLAEAASRLGFALVPAKLTVAELASLGSPTVILFEETDLGRGRFHLLVGLSSSQAYLVDGGFIRHGEQMPIDRFRRGWTGFALVPRSASPWPGRVLGMAAGAVLAGTAGWLARRAARTSQRLPSALPGGTLPFSSEVV